LEMKFIEYFILELFSFTKLERRNYYMLLPTTKCSTDN